MPRIALEGMLFHVVSQEQVDISVTIFSLIHFRIYLIFFFVCVCMIIYMAKYIQVALVAKRCHTQPLELKLQAAVSPPVCGLRTNSGPV